MKGGTDFGFSGGRHHVVEVLGDGIDRAVERGVSERWIGRVSGLVAKEIVATDTAASAGFRKVGDFTVEVQDHVPGAISDGGVRVGRSIIEYPNGCVTGCLRLVPAQDVHFFYTRSHLSALQNCALIFSTNF